MGKILVVEDDPAILETISYNLRREQHEVLTATNGVDGLSTARQCEPELVVLDLMLPRLSGLDVCRALRAEGPVLILVLTARETEVDRVVGLEMGADDYMTKPFSMRELLTRVGALLRRDRISREAAQVAAPDQGRGRIECGDLILDAGAHEVRRAGKPLALRPREFELLEYFFRHPGQVLSRQMILDAVWGYSYDGESRTVDVHVRWLREKLEEDPSVPQRIVTVRHFGYKFVA
ncbi:MAG: DNA-binding response regulator [Chloroflexi bacterium]|nr:MAG: DNA-binding response regulator [Chloroflexota bacterium]